MMSGPPPKDEGWVHGESSRLDLTGGPEEDAVALVTGGSRGIGRAVALGLGAAGFRVAIMARSRAELSETAELLERRGVQHAWVVTDVTDADEVARSVRQVEGQIGPVSVLVNNAGTALAIGPLWEVDDREWWRDIETSLGGVFNLCRSVIPGMIARGHGRILNVSSYAAARAAPYETAYAGAKAAVTNLTESLAVSLAPHRVRVFAVTPGFVHTEMTKRIIESPEGRRWLPEAGEREGLDPERFVRLVVALAQGHGDTLSGRFLHALDDLDELLSRLDEIDREELYVPRLRRLPGR